GMAARGHPLPGVGAGCWRNPASRKGRSRPMLYGTERAGAVRCAPCVRSFFGWSAMKQFPIAVVMERRRLNNPWVDEAWEAVGVVPAFEEADPAPRRILAESGRGQ